MRKAHSLGKPSLGSSVLRCATAAVLAVGLMLPASGLQALAEEAPGGGASLADSSWAAGAIQEAHATAQYADGSLVAGDVSQVPTAGTFAAPVASPFAADETVDDLIISGGVKDTDFSVSGKIVTVKTSTPLTLKGTLSGGSIRIDVGVKANITLNNATITASGYESPINLMSSGTTNGCELRLTIADGTTNALTNTGTNTTAKKGRGAAGIHVGFGSTLYIDDARPNWSGTTHVGVLAGVVASDAVLDDGTTVKAGDPLSAITSENPGTLIVKGGWHASAIGAGPLEVAGTMVFDGGIIRAYAWGGSNQNGGTGTAIGVTNAASKDDHRAGGAAIGGSHGGSATEIVFNSGNIIAAGSYHGAGIGAGWSNLSTGLNWLPEAKQTGASTKATPSPLVCGNITINGGRIVSQGYAHGNAFGGACGTNATGCTIRVTGGTLLPYSFVGKDAENNSQNLKDIGGTGGHVIVSGGSVRLSGSQAEKFQSVDSNKAYSDDTFKTEVAPITINLSDDLGAVDAPIEHWELLIDGKPVDYGAPTELDKGNLYLWLSNEDAKKDVKIILYYDNGSGDVVQVEPLETQGGGTTAKRWIPFDMKEEYFPGGLTKPYDGTPMEKWSLAKNPVSIDTSTAVGSQSRTLNSDEFVTIKFQRIDENGTPLEEFHSGTEMPTETGRMAFRMESTQFGNDPQLTSYWGHSTEGICEITPVPAIVHINSVEWGYLDEKTGVWTPIKKGEANAGIAGNRLKLNFYIRPADGNATTCAAPTGSFQVRIDGENVGSPIVLNEDGFKAASPSSKISWGDQQGYHATEVEYYFDPTNKDALLKLLESGDGAEHLVGVEYLADKNYIQGVEKNPDNAQEDEAFIIPVAPVGDVTPDGPVKIEEGGSDVPGGDTPGEDKMTIVRKTITTSYGNFYKNDPEIKNFFSLVANSTSSAPAQYDTTNPAVAGFVFGSDGLPVFDEDGKVRVQVNSCGTSILTIEQKPNALYTGIKYILTVVVTPDPAIKPKVQIRLTSRNLTALAERVDEAAGTEIPEGDVSALVSTVAAIYASDASRAAMPPRPGDVMEYTVTGLNLTPGSAWQAAQLTDAIGANLTFDPASVEIASNYATHSNQYQLGTSQFYEGFDWDALSWEPVAPADYTFASQELSKTIGSVYGGQSTSVRFQATVADGLGKRLGDDEPLPTIESTPGGSGGYGKDEEGLEPGESVSNPEPLAPGTDIVVIGEGGTDPTNPMDPVDDDPTLSEPVLPRDPNAPDLVTEVKVDVVKTEEEHLPDRILVGDTLHVTATSTNKAPDSKFDDVVIRVTLPKGVEPVAGTLMLKDAQGKPHPVPDSAYDPVTGIVAVHAGDLYGLESAELSFDAVVESTLQTRGPEENGGDRPDEFPIKGGASGDTPTDEWTRTHPDGPDGAFVDVTDPAPGTPVSPADREGGVTGGDGFDPEMPPVLPRSPSVTGPNPDITVEKVAQNATRDDGTTQVGDTVHYTVTLANSRVGSIWYDAVIRDDLPRGVEPMSGTITLTAPNGQTSTVPDDAYDVATRVLGVKAGDLPGGTAAVLEFDALVTDDAVGADIGNVATSYGTRPADAVPSEVGSDTVRPTPGEPFQPDEGWGTWSHGKDSVANEQPAYPAGTSKEGGVKPSDGSSGPGGTMLASTGTKGSTILSKTGDEQLTTMTAWAFTASTALLVLLVALWRNRRRVNA